MIEELLKIIFTADKLIVQQQTIIENESIPSIASYVEELKIMDEKITNTLKKI